MSDLEHDAIKIAKYLYKNKHTLDRWITYADLRKAIKLDDADFDAADEYLVRAKYTGASGIGEYERWLTPAGVEYAASKSTLRRRWSKTDVIALVGVLVAILALAASLTFPEVRKLLHLEKEKTTETTK